MDNLPDDLVKDIDSWVATNLVATCRRFYKLIRADYDRIEYWRCVVQRRMGKTLLTSNPRVALGMTICLRKNDTRSAVINYYNNAAYSSQRSLQFTT